MRIEVDVINRLKKVGVMGDSYQDVITKLLDFYEQHEYVHDHDRKRKCPKK